MDFLKFPQHTAVVGGSMGGKTTLVQDILDQIYQQFKVIIIFSDTALETHEYDPFRLKLIVHGIQCGIFRWNLSSFNEVIDTNRTLRLPTLVLLDDCSRSLYSSVDAAKGLAGVLTECRHANTSIMISAHSAKGLLLPLLREQIHVWIFSKLAVPTLETLEELFCYDKDDHGGESLKRMVKRIRGSDRYTYVVWDVRTDEVYKYRVNLEQKNQERKQEMAEILAQMKSTAALKSTAPAPRQPAF